MLKTTLEQWQVLRSVVEQGSIAKAAEQTFKSQPAISYQLSQLQQRLGIEILNLKGRKLVLTEQGRILLEQAVFILDQWRDLEARAEALTQGERAVISLVVDSLFPKSDLFNGLKRFNQAFPNTHVHVKETVRDEGMMLLNQGNDDLYIISAPENLSVTKSAVMTVEVIPVAHKEHPIFQVPSHLREAKLKCVPMIQVVDKYHQQPSDEDNRYQDSWFFTSLSSAVDAIINQLGYGWIPISEIHQYLDNGTLCPIFDDQQMLRNSTLYLIKNQDARHDSVIHALEDALLENILPKEEHHTPLN